MLECLWNLQMCSNVGFTMFDVSTQYHRYVATVTNVVVCIYPIDKQLTNYITSKQQNNKQQKQTKQTTLGLLIVLAVMAY